MNLKSILSSAALSCLLAVVAMAPTPANAANTDYKTFHASGGCKVYGSTSWTSIGFGWQGVANLTSSPVYIICPLITDSDTGWTATSMDAMIHVHARSGNVAANVTCVVYTSYADTLVQSQTVSFSMAANTTAASNNTDWLTNYSGSDGGAMMLCQLGPKATLAHYSLYEYAPTNTVTP